MAPVTPVRRLVAIARNGWSRSIGIGGRECAHRSGSFAVTAPDDADANAIFVANPAFFTRRGLVTAAAKMPERDTRNSHSLGWDASLEPIRPRLNMKQLSCLWTRQIFFLAGLWDLAILRSKTDHNHKDEDVASSARWTRNQR